MIMYVKILTITSLLTIMQKNTRNRNKLLKLPRVKLEFSKQWLIYMGAILYNDLLLNICPCEIDQNFTNISLNIFFKHFLCYSIFYFFKLFSMLILIICASCLFSSYLNSHSTLSFSVLIILCIMCVFNFFIFLGHSL